MIVSGLEALKYFSSVCYTLISGRYQIKKNCQPLHEEKVLKCNQPFILKHHSLTVFLY